MRRKVTSYQLMNRSVHGKTLESVGAAFLPISLKYREKPTKSAWVRIILLANAGFNVVVTHQSTSSLDRVKLLSPSCRRDILVRLLKNNSHFIYPCNLDNKCHNNPTQVQVTCYLPIQTWGVEGRHLHLLHLLQNQLRPGGRCRQSSDNHLHLNNTIRSSSRYTCPCTRSNLLHYTVRPRTG